MMMLIYSLYLPPKVEIKTVEVEKILYRNVSTIYYSFQINDLVSSLIANNKKDELEKVYRFYDKKTSDRNITATIIEVCIEKHVPINLGFALAWKESRFNPRNISENKDSRGRVLSTDWGLFSLNDKERKNWSVADFFDIRKNTEEALSFFSYLYCTFDSLDLATAAFNSGRFTIKNRKAIQYVTLVHNFEIKNYEFGLDREFSSIVVPEFNLVFNNKGVAVGIK